jgi:adenosine deaminase
MSERGAFVEAYIRRMPKVELHVHLEGAIQPSTLLALARRNRVQLPIERVEDLQAWYTFTSFAHFVEIFTTVSTCICTPDDIELVAREFLAGQAAQGVLYTEATYTAYTHFSHRGISFRDQLAALNRARAWAAATLGTDMGLIIDIPRDVSAEDGLLVTDWAISGMGDGVVALGLGGAEVGNPPERYAACFARAHDAGLPCVPHAGETVGPESIWSALRLAHPARIEHGVRCLEDPALVAELLERQIPLDVCPTSNVCLGVAATLGEHPLLELLDAGLYLTINSDDPPMFNTTLTGEYLALSSTFGLDLDAIDRLAFNAVRASLLPPDERAALERRFEVARRAPSNTG